jgi:hypothetical protein
MHGSAILKKIKRYKILKNTQYKLHLKTIGDNITIETPLLYEKLEKIYSFNSREKGSIKPNKPFY